MSDGTHTTQSAGPPLSRAVILAVLAASAAVAGFAVSNQSFWIDEGLSLIVAMAPGPSDAWRYANAVSGSTLQMPLYQVFLFVWHKVFGSGEWMMRASNIPWFVLAQLAFLVVLRHRPRLALTASLLAAVSPLLWMYLDETRPYVMQYTAAAWLTAILARLSDPRCPGAPDPRLLAAAAAAAVVLFGSSLLGVIWSGGFLAGIVLLSAGRRTADDASASPPSRRGLLVGAAAAAVAAAVFAAYYAWTWADAGRGYHRSGGALLSPLFIAYELLGFSGFGPGKLQMRASPVGSILHSLPALLPLAACLALLVLPALRRRTLPRVPRRTAIAWTFALVLPPLGIFAAMLVFGNRPLPRHMIPLAPALMLGLAAAMHAALARKSIVWRAAAVLLPLLWLGSSLNLRWQPRHAKDDYRRAAAVAAAAVRDNKEVWWAADPAAAYVYLTPVSLEQTPGRAWAMQAPGWDDIRFKFPPRVIVISKPDIYDPQGAIARYAAENQFAPALQLQAFTIFTRHGEPLP